MRRRSTLPGRRSTAARALVGGAILVAGLFIAVGPAHATGLSPVPVPAPVAPAAAIPAPSVPVSSVPVSSVPVSSVPPAPPRTTATPVPAGEQYVIADKELCTTGFAVTTPGGRSGFVSAGHCGSAGDTVQTAAGAQLGTFAASAFPGTDYGWVLTNAQFAPAGFVAGPDGAHVAVRGDTPAPVGSTVCLSGQASGWHCGTITAVNQSVQYDQGVVEGLTATTICSDAGDSGGALLSDDQAQGVVSGGIGDCASHGTTYFQPLRPILQAYGLTLRTS